MTEGGAENGTVLVVEDEDYLADLYTDYLTGTYDVRTAYGGIEAMEMLDSDIDVVLLDRRMPVVSGNEVLAEINDHAYQCRVAMVTAVDPDFDIIDMGCDDYIVKPVTRDELLRIVERLMTIAEYDERMRELTAKKLKRNVLEVEKTRIALRESSEFERLENEIAALEAEIDSLADDLDTYPATREL